MKDEIDDILQNYILYNMKENGEWQKSSPERVLIGQAREFMEKYAYIKTKPIKDELDQIKSKWWYKLFNKL